MTTKATVLEEEFFLYLEHYDECVRIEELLEAKAQGKIDSSSDILKKFNQSPELEQMARSVVIDLPNIQVGLFLENLEKLIQEKEVEYKIKEERPRNRREEWRTYFYRIQNKGAGKKRNVLSFCFEVSCSQKSVLLSIWPFDYEYMENSQKENIFSILKKTLPELMDAKEYNEAEEDEVLAIYKFDLSNTDAINDAEIYKKSMSIIERLVKCNDEVDKYLREQKEIERDEDNSK